ncbi:MAG: hypothetical protein A2287_06400 [Candidatus Melainabacteria bacterium RIFOXYA12_FULL_32_12]|nr:MAG: hypothetical protein A2255_06880 [Candidatus Melainabacteria bacterium RIFOXYA2_FULL_32_9]OGI31579.1 MAG: hypothetical protein A2287_06400 [Candidatus Melainabacteria bacterium RIFOXYA12_FULL_32_12]
MNLFLDWLKNLKIAQKELFLIAVTSIFMIFVGLVGLFFTIRSITVINDMYENRLLSVEYLNTIRANTQVIEADLYKLIFTPNPNLRQEYLADINRRAAEWQNLFQKYTAVRRDPYEIENIQIMRSEISQIANARNTIIQLAIAGQREQAYNSYQQYIILLNDFNQRIENLAAYNENEAAKAYRQYRSIAILAIILIPLAILFALALSIPLGLIISGFISNPANALKDKMEKVTRGNINIEPAEVHSKDEIGELSGSFNTMTQNLNYYIEREGLLRRITETIRESLDINEVLTIICEEVARLFDADRAVIVEYPNNQNYQEYIVRREYLANPKVKGFSENFDPRAGAYWGENVLNKGTTLAIDNISQSDTPDYFKTNYLTMGINSIINVPIMREPNKWGTLGLSTIRLKHWTEDEINLLETIADQIYIAINQAELYSITKKQAEKSDLIRRIIEAIGGTLDSEAIFNIVCNEILDLFKVDRVAIGEFIAPGDYSKLSRIVEVTSNPAIIKHYQVDIPFELNKYLGEKIVEKGQDVRIDNIEDEEVPDFYRDFHHKIGTKSILNIPIRRGDKKLGIMAIYQNSYFRHWTDEEVDLMHIIAKQVYIAVRQAELYSDTKNLADRENLLRTIINEILTSESLIEALNSISTEVGNLFDIDRVTLRLYDPILKAFTDIASQYRKSENIPPVKSATKISPELDQFLIQELFEKGEILVINNLNDPKLPEAVRDNWKEINVKSIVIAPITYKDTPLAAIFLTNTEKDNAISPSSSDLLALIAQQIAIGINMFQLTDKLNKSLNSERIIRDILFESRKQEKHDQIYNYLLEKLAKLFDVSRVLHLHYDKNRNLTVHNEVLVNKELEPILNQPILLAKFTEELEPKTYGEAIVINDIDKEISNPELKEYLKSKNIESFVIYPLAKRLPAEKRELITATTMLCSIHPKLWASNEIDAFKLAIDTTSLVYFELIERKESEDTRNTFIATLTHDLRSPISAEQKALEAILSKKLGLSLENFSDYLEDIYRINEELLRIVNNLLSIYHYESGKFTLNLQPNNIQDIISHAVRSMIPLAKDQQSEITTNIQENLPEIMIDRDEINRVITNLISNAIKHTRKGTAITISAHKTDNEIQIAVSDNGQGIPESERSKIFQRYPTTKRKIGTGLGLYLSKQIIDAHQGKIWFYTKLGEGTTFYFTLPTIRH